jgi:hypothetical protein
VANGGLRRFGSAANEWQRVTVALADFTLAEDTKPVNNKLDMDEVEGLGLIDVSALFATTPEAAILFGDQTGDAHAVAGRLRVPIGRARAPALRPTRSTTSSAIT